MFHAANRMIHGRHELSIGSFCCDEFEETRAFRIVEAVDTDGAFASRVVHVFGAYLCRRISSLEFGIVRKHSQGNRSHVDRLAIELLSW